MKKKIMIRLALAIFVITQNSAWAATPEEIRARIQAELSQRHPEPSAPFWSSLGPEASAVILQMLSENPGAYTKTRLVEGLGYFNTPEIDQYLKTNIQNSTNAVLKKKMLLSLVHSQGEASRDFVEPYLKDKDAHIRSELAQALKLNENTHVKPALQNKIVTRHDSVMAAPAIKQKEIKEADLVGEWSGVWVTPHKNIKAKLKLALLDAKAMQADQKWKLAFEFTQKLSTTPSLLGYELFSFQTDKAMWVEVRFKKENIVFLAQKPSSP